MNNIVIGAALAAFACGAADVKATLEKRFLPEQANLTTWVSILDDLEEMDVAADEAWKAVGSRQVYDARRAAMRGKMIAAVGGFPAERPPLNARITGTYKRDGYRIEKVIFETWPSVHETGLMFVPEDPAFKAPYPVTVVTCGHSVNGKNCPTYQRAGVQLAKAGIAAFVYDPFEQGERLQSEICCHGHNIIGVRASLLGGSTARYRIWDGMRAIDYVLSRGDVDGDKVGYMGQSGGGTMTALMMAVDPRIKAAAPSCYLTTLRHLCAKMGPQDAEQNIFGQLAFGLNHAGYVVLQHLPVCMVGRFNDMFPYAGARDTFRVAQAVERTLGETGRFEFAFAPGPHGWTESTRTMSVAWMRRWLRGEDVAIDPAAARRLDCGFSEAKADCGLAKADWNVTPTGKVLDLPGERSVFDLMRDDYAAALKARARRSPAETAALVKRLAGIETPAEARLSAVEAGREAIAGGEAVRIGFMRANGFSVPGVLLVPAASKGAPALLAGDAGRGAWAARAAELFAAGRPVLVADLTGLGEVGGCEKAHVFYAAEKYPDEGPAVMLYLMGKSMVGRRATDLLALADFLKAKFGAAPTLETAGRTAIPAAHAWAADRTAFAAAPAVKDAPKSWAALLDTKERYPFVNCVNGALLHYDWPDLLK